MVWIRIASKRISGLRTGWTTAADPSVPSGTMTNVHNQDREILRLAVPAFFAVVSEPLMLLADSAIVGHLGTPQLAALGVAGAVLQTVVGACIFPGLRDNLGGGQAARCRRPPGSARAGRG